MKWFANDFHLWLNYFVKLLVNWLTCDKKLLFTVSHTLHHISFILQPLLRLLSWYQSSSPVTATPWVIMRPVSGLNTPVCCSQLPAGDSPADTLAPAISRGCPSCLHWLLTWVACGAHPCRSCMVAHRDYFQDDKEASGIFKIIKIMTPLGVGVL